MSIRVLRLAAAAACLLATSTHAHPLLLISLDGLRPDDVLEAEQRHLSVPHLRAFVRDGAYANAVHGVLPTLTYPSHTTLITGVAPAAHGIVSNLTFDPLVKNQQGWYWYAQDIHATTLWDAARAAHLVTANVHWPVSVGASVDYNLPQVWRAGTADDRKLLRALSTPGLLDSLEHELGTYADGIDETIEGDENRARFAERIIETRHPSFMTAYFTALDHVQHHVGIDTSEARATLERLDLIVGRLVAAARKSDPQTVVAVVSDHGFAPLEHDVNLARAFIEAGLISLDDKGQVARWDATPWYDAGSAAIVLRDGQDAAARTKTRALLDKLAGDPANGIARVMAREEIGKRGGAPQAEYFLLFKPGYQMGTDPHVAMVAPSKLHGMHGYDPDLDSMQSTFLVAGAGIPEHRALGRIDMRDIAPTLARQLGVELPHTEGKALF